MRLWIAAAACAWSLAVAAVEAQPRTEPTDPMTEARALAAAGDRAAAVALLEKHLAGSPQDGDAEVLLGLVLSWDQQYEAARVHLRRVLADDPTHGDALPALMNVETRSGHPENAVALATPVLNSSETGAPTLLAAARAYRSLGQLDEARRLVDRAAAADPESEEVRTLGRSLVGPPRWDVRAIASTDWFSDDREAWRESVAWVTHRADGAFGTLVGRVSLADRFERVDQQFEVDVYPRLGPGTYAYLNAGVSSHGRLYPDYRLGVELNQRVPHGFELSGGVRRLVFDRGVNVLVGAVTKYRGPWMMTARLFHVPDERASTTSAQGVVRRYFGADGTSFVGAHFGRGRNLEDLRTIDQVALLDARTGGASLDAVVSRRVRIMVRTEASLGDRPFGGSAWQYTFGAGLGWVF